MIEINLLPEELKVKARNRKSPVADFVDKKYLMYLIPLIGAILLFTHLCLGIITLARSGNYRSLNAKWKSMEPDRKKLADFNKLYGLLTEDNKAVKKLIDQRIGWSEKLNKLSLYLPSGIWFRDISVSKSDFVLLGSAVSLQKEEMGMLKNFIDSLKNDSDFFKDFKSLELSSVQARNIGGYDVVDFTLIGALK